MTFICQSISYNSKVNWSLIKKHENLEFCRNNRITPRSGKVLSDYIYIYILSQKLFIRCFIIYAINHTNSILELNILPENWFPVVSVPGKINQFYSQFHRHVRTISDGNLDIFQLKPNLYCIHIIQKIELFNID